MSGRICDRKDRGVVMAAGPGGEGPVYYDYAGVVHVHTRYSGDSGASVGDVLEAAQRGGADFVVITDHNSVSAAWAEGWHDEVLLLVGEEVSPPGGDHYLALGLEATVPPRESPQAVIDLVASRGGLGFIEHPFFQGNRIFGIEACAWSDWGVEGYTGMSIFNFTTDWGEKLTGFRYLLFGMLPGLAVDAPNPRTMAKWDELLAKGLKVVGIGTVDAHLVRVKIGGKTREVHPFRYFFRSLRTHVLLRERLTGRLERDRSLVYDALREGACFVANDYLADGQGFRFYARAKSDVWPAGQEATLGDQVELVAESPRVGFIRILRHGRVVAAGLGRRLRCPARRAGAYRCEVRLFHKYRFKPWIYSNPVYVRERAGS